MELTALVWCGLLSLSIFSWTYGYSGLTYYTKWLIIYVVLWWRRLAHEKPDVPLFASLREEHLEKPRVWTKEKPFRRDSMLVFAGGQDVYLLMELARGRNNSAAVRLNVQLTSGSPVYQTPDDETRACACSGWTTDSLALQCLEPMRRWRIVFSGRLCCRDGSAKKRSQLVKINLIWTALCGPYHYTKDCDISVLTSALAQLPLSHLHLNLESLGKGYEQWGTVRGSVSINGIDTSIHTPSLRSHQWGWPHVNTRLGLVGVADNGTLFSMAYTFANIKTQLGCVRYPDGRVETLVGDSTLENSIVGEKFVRTFSSRCLSHTVYVVRCPWQQWGALKWARASCVLDYMQAVCVVLAWDKGMREELPELPLLEFLAVESSELVVSLDHPVCSSPHVVGGKAASLALLADSAQTVLRHKVVVPAGFCLTTQAMQMQTQSSQSLVAAVKYLSLISSGQQTGSLQEECQHVVSAWVTVPLCPALLAVLSERVHEGRSYAVRSSGLGEDSLETSAAGQNATVLGCVGLHAVIMAVHKCWASLYSFQSVQYRRQAGLPVESLMGVVVQEMVEAETAGVMFTRDPVTSDPCRLLITANYGLGETVVSGSSEPDTFIVNTERSGHLEIVSTVRGSKKRKLTVTDEGGVQVESTSSELTESLCLTQPEVIALAHIGLSLEQLFGWPRDVEWAINKGVIYLLQCRPVTASTVWSQEELTHELDSAILPGDVTSTANTGEVFPGATSPLCQSTALRCADFVMIQQFAGIQYQLWYNNNKLVTSHHRTLLNLFNTLLFGAAEEPTLQQKVLELAVCGHKISTPQIQKAAAARSTSLNVSQKLLTILHFLKVLVTNKRAAKKAQKIGEQFKISFDNFTSAGALYAYITSCHTGLVEVFLLHTRVTFASTLWQTILFSILAEGKQELSNENIRDIAQLLVDKQTAVSAQVPADIKELTRDIKTSENWQDVAHLPPEKVPAWLEHNCPAASAKLADIIQRYQHRNIKELDVMTQTWGLDSRPLVSMLQTMLLNSPDDKRTRVQDESKDAVGMLKSPKKPLTRWVLRWLVSMSRAAAGLREGTKDGSLKVVHQFRLAYQRLGQLMCEEGLLPSPTLVSFCTHYEISQILSGPNPSLIHKILHRQRCWQQWEQLQFPEVMTGLPTPVQLHSHPLLKDEGSVEGTLVCGGSVRGRACVLLTCADSHILRTGDILITHSTDVGWTPLFPLLAGVVTELGGLISHGAVVAREYGLPCVVGATNATLVFKTGDEVYLDGINGKVHKVSTAA